MDSAHYLSARAPSRTLPSDSPLRQQKLLDIWLALEVAGLCLLPLALITVAFASSVRRNPTVTNLLVTWTISAFGSCLLFLAHQQSGPEPSKGLCIFQSSLIYASVPLCATSALGLVLNLWFTLRSALSPRRGGSSLIRWRMPLLIASPYFIGMIFFIAAIALQAQFPATVTRNRKFFYCSMDGRFGVAVAGFSALLVQFVIFFEVWVAILMYRHWIRVRDNEHKADGIKLSMVIRIGVFSLYGVVAGTVSLITIWDPNNAFSYMFLATVPLASFLVFSTQRDIINVWCFWRKKTEVPPQVPEKDFQQIHSSASQQV